MDSNSKSNVTPSSPADSAREFAIIIQDDILPPLVMKTISEALAVIDMIKRGNKPDFIHVIEYAAFEKLQRELADAKANSLPSFNVSVPSDEWYDTVKERDKLQAELADVRENKNGWQENCTGLNVKLAEVRREIADLKQTFEFRVQEKNDKLFASWVECEKRLTQERARSAKLLEALEDIDRDFGNGVSRSASDCHHIARAAIKAHHGAGGEE